VSSDHTLLGHHRVDAVRAHLLDRAGDHAAAQFHYAQAARRTLNLPEQRYLSTRAAQLQPHPALDADTASEGSEADMPQR
jgi:predicted RNA polymerase sigma factor